MYDKDNTYKENLYYANLKREQRINDELDEISRDKKDMERLQNEIEQEKQREKEKRNYIKQQQYEDYSNYMNRKYATPAQYREKLNIKLGGENRAIKKQTYNEQMDNLCINPTRQRNICTPATKNYSEMGRNYQRGYSHGYNILTGEVYSNDFMNKLNKNNNNNEENYNEKKEMTPQINNNFVNENNFNNNKREENRFPKTPNQNINFNVEDYKKFQEYMEMKRQKEFQEMENNNYNNNRMQNNDQQYNNPQQQEIPYEPQFQRGQRPFSAAQPYNQNNNYYNRDNDNKNIPYQNYEQKPFTPQNENREMLPPEYKYNNMEMNNPNNINQYVEQERNNNIPYNENREQMPPEYQREMMMRQQQDIDEIEFQKKLSLKDNNQQYPYQKNNNEYPEQINSQEEYKNYLLNKQNNEQEPKDPERERYMQFLLSQQNKNPNMHPQEMENNYNNNFDDKNYNDYNNPLSQQQYQNYMENNNNRPPSSYPNNIPNREIPPPDYYQQQPPKNDNIQYNNFMQKNDIPPKNAINDSNDSEIYQNYLAEMKKQQMENEYKRKQQMEEEYYRQKQMEEEYYRQQQMEKEYYQQQQMQNMQNNIPQNQIQNNQNNNQNDARAEYIQNKKKYTTSNDNIFSVKAPQQAPPKYTDEPLTEAEKKQIQRDYAKYLDLQINEKNKRYSKGNPYKKINPLLDGNNSGGKHEENQEDNPYELMRKKNSKLNDIPPDPYNNKNYDLDSKSKLEFNPITNPVNSYYFGNKNMKQNNGL